ncbi:MAG: MTH1187 family thiamine-binding protein [Candidatus Krumholzibacteriota bacterium]|nr:MTH1187 family thiamine-binding protein [Candidatus Krumholzibacteriota bacterium]
MLAFFTIVPAIAGESLGEPVARVLDLVDRSGLPYRFGPMGTTVEGEWDEVMDLVKRCHLLMREYSGRVSTLVKIDDRAGATGRLEGKLDSVEKRLGRKLRR